MNREHKLSLVLGFGLLLFVGILLSDHFSAVDRPVSSAMVASAEPRRSGPSTIQPMSAVREGVIERPVAVVEDFDNLGNGAQGATPLPQGTPAPGINAPRVHVVAAGDTFSTIALREYGSKQYAKALWEHNRATIPQPNRMTIGARLAVPPLHTLTGRAPEQPRQPELPVTATANPGRTYTVKAGDTLGSIAKSQLGSTSRWKDLLTANAKTLRDPKQMKIGMTLVVPQ